MFNTETLECHLKSEWAGLSKTAGVESGDIVSSPCSCVPGRRSHLYLLGPETHCCCHSLSTSSWYLKHKHSHRWRQHSYYKLSGCICPAGCSATSHLQGAARPVSAGCFCEMEGSFLSWRGGVGVGSTWQLERRYQGAGLYPSSGTSPQSLASDWPAGRAPPPGVCIEKREGEKWFMWSLVFSDQFVICSQIRMWPVLFCRLVILISVSAASNT